MNSRPTFTIAIPVRNGAEFLEEALDSALNQSFEDYEIMISDNASTDRTPEIIASYKAKHPHIRSVRGEQMISLSENWNRVYDLAAGEWVKILAHDDIMHRDCLKRIHEETAKLPKCALDRIALIGTGEYWLFDGGVRYANTISLTSETSLLLKAPDYLKAHIRGTAGVCLPAATTATLHKPVIAIAGPYDQRYSQSDTILYMRLLVEHDYLYIPDALCENRIQKASAHNTLTKGRRGVEEQIAFSREFLPTVEKKLEMGFYASMRFRMRPASQAASQVARGILCREMAPLWAALTATPAWQLPMVLLLTLRALRRDMRKLRQIGLPARTVL